MVKTAAAQDPHAWPRPCPLSLKRCWALCTGNLGQAVTVLCSKTADTKLDILNSSVLFCLIVTLTTTGWQLIEMGG